MQRTLNSVQNDKLTQLLNNVDRERMRKEIGYILSPGSNQSKNLFPPSPLPTGGNFIVLQETKQIDKTFAPDASGSILLLLTPFFEAPLIRVVLNENFTFASWYAVQLAGYSFDESEDPLRSSHYYAYRFIASSMTARMTSNMTTSQGSVHAWYQPLSIDTKKVYTNTTLGETQSPLLNPIMNMRTLDRIPITTDQISKVTKTYYQGSATEGAYVVGRHTDPEVPFTYRNCDENKATVNLYYGGNGGLAPVPDPTDSDKTYYYKNYLCFADDTQFGVYLKSSDSADAPPLPVSAPTCMDLSCILFTGLAVDQGPTVNVKVVLTVEEIPKYNSKNIGYAKPMVARDEAFLRTLYLAEQRAPRVGNANSNSFGSFMNALNGIITAAAPIAKAVSTSLPPQYATVVSSIADTLPKITQAVNQVANDSKQTQKQVQMLTNKMSQSQIAAMPNVVSNYTVPTQQFTPATRRPVSVRPR